MSYDPIVKQFNFSKNELHKLREAVSLLIQERNRTAGDNNRDSIADHLYNELGDMIREWDKD